MDFSALGSTLPPGLADAERDMGDKFRAAALSITNLYKSSLGYTKQAYHVGYSAALADVLSTVQSSIGAGQDAEQTLSRLMDWADARQAAISAFATDDADELPPPASKARPTTLSRPSLSHLAPHHRAASAPVPDHAGSSASRPGTKENRNMTESISGSHSRMTGLMSTASTSTSTPNTSLDSSAYQPTPADIMSSSPSASPSIRHTQQLLSTKPAKSLPLRFIQQSRAESSASHPTQSVPTSNFNPSIPLAGIPFVAFTNDQDGAAPAQNYNLGAKRPLLDMTMEVEESPAQANPPSVMPTTPAPPQSKGGRASKRRSVGLGVKNDDGETDGRDKDRERRRGSKRHGPGAGTA